MVWRSRTSVTRPDVGKSKPVTSVSVLERQFRPLVTGRVRRVLPRHAKSCLYHSGVLGNFPFVRTKIGFLISEEIDWSNVDLGGGGGY